MRTGKPARRSGGAGALVRSHPGARLAECGGDFALAHLLGDLATKRDRIQAALQGGEVEPFVRGDQIDDAGTGLVCPQRLGLQSLVHLPIMMYGVLPNESPWIYPVP
jgi:hypothetical protein